MLFLILLTLFFWIIVPPPEFEIPYTVALPLVEILLIVFPFILFPDAASPEDSRIPYGPFPLVPV